MQEQSLVVKLHGRTRTRGMGVQQIKAFSRQLSRERCGCLRIRNVPTISGPRSINKIALHKTHTNIDSGDWHPQSSVVTCYAGKRSYSVQLGMRICGLSKAQRLAPNPLFSSGICEQWRSIWLKDSLGRLGTGNRKSSVVELQSCCMSGRALHFYLDSTARL